METTDDRTDLPENQFKISKDAVGYFYKKFKKIQDRARKIGAPAPSYKILDDSTTKARHVPVWTSSGYRYIEKEVPALLIEVAGEAPKFEGWSFVATLHPITDTSTAVMTVPGSELEIPKKYWERDATYCDHCRAARFRKETFLVHSESEGFKQVGRQCLKDFLGHQSPEQVAAQASFVCSWLEDLTEDSRGWDELSGMRGGYREELFEVEGLLRVSAMMIREFGWKSVSQAEVECRTSTASHVRQWVGYGKKYFSSSMSVTDGDRELASRTLAWVEGLDPRSDYERNLVVAVQAGSVDWKMIGIVASAVASYQRSQEKERTEAIKKESRYVGEVGKRGTFEVTVLNVREVCGDWGISYLHKMADQDGNLFSWFYSGSGENLEEGRTYKIKGTVKKHQEFNGRRETQLSRCTVL